MIRELFVRPWPEKATGWSIEAFGLFNTSKLPILYRCYTSTMASSTGPHRVIGLTYTHLRLRRREARPIESSIDRSAALRFDGWPTDLHCAKPSVSLGGGGRTRNDGAPRRRDGALLESGEATMELDWRCVPSTYSYLCRFGAASTQGLGAAPKAQPNTSGYRP